MTAAAPLQRRACAMQIQITDLLQGRAAESLAALLNPPDRDIPKRAEVQPADPRVTLKKKKKKKNAPCLSGDREQHPLLPLNPACL